jgi:hypothetical protein
MPGARLASTMGVEGVTTTFFSLVAGLAVLPTLLGVLLVVVVDVDVDLVPSQPAIVKNMLMKNV